MRDPRVSEWVALVVEMRRLEPVRCRRVFSILKKYVALAKRQEEILRSPPAASRRKPSRRK